MSESDPIRVFDDWIERHRTFLLKVARAYADGADLDDLFQEIAIEVWKSIPLFRGESSERTWLYRIAIRTGISWVKRRQRRLRESGSSLADVLEATPASDEPRDPRAEWLHEQIASLNEIDRSLALLLLDGCTYAEIASVLGLTESNVGVKVHRIKQDLIRKAQQLSTEVTP